MFPFKGHENDSLFNHNMPNGSQLQMLSTRLYDTNNRIKFTAIWKTDKGHLCPKTSSKNCQEGKENKGPKIHDNLFHENPFIQLHWCFQEFERATFWQIIIYDFNSTQATFYFFILIGKNLQPKWYKLNLVIKNLHNI